MITVNELSLAETISRRQRLDESRLLDFTEAEIRSLASIGLDATCAFAHRSRLSINGEQDSHFDVPLSRMRDAIDRLHRAMVMRIEKLKQ